MAQIREFPAHSHRVLSLRTTSYLKTRIILSALAFAALIIPAAHAQLQPPLVFSSAGAVASRNDQTGLLTPVAGSPFTAANQTLEIDVQGRYLFAIGTSSIHMYEINNPTTGAYQEVANSPFASSVTNQPAYIAVEPTGQFNRCSQPCRTRPWRRFGGNAPDLAECPWRSRAHSRCRLRHRARLNSHRLRAATK